MDPQSPFQLKEELAAKESMCGKTGEVLSALPQADARFFSGPPLPALPGPPVLPLLHILPGQCAHPLAGNHLLS